MNCVFRILWFEDELSWFRMEQIKVKQILSSHCLDSEIVRKNGDDFELSELCGNSFDLIIMDYKLASGATGDKIISAIRMSNILTDVLFYSSEEDKMREAIYNAAPPIDGIYYTERKIEPFTSKVKGLINKIVKRSEDLINLRGFVLDNSCDFEVRVKELLNIAWQKFPKDEQAVLEEAVHKTLEKKDRMYFDSHQKIVSQSPSFPPAVNNEHFFSHSDRLYLLTKIIKILQSNYGFQARPEHENFKYNYEDSISQYRNALGHRKCGENTIEIQKRAIPIDEALHQRMRSNITLYNSLINEIEEYISKYV